MKKRHALLAVFSFFILAGFVLPEPKVIPVKGASSKDWNQDSFWYEPWGSSGVHKGIDIFAAKQTPVIAPTNLFLLYQGEIRKGGKVIIALGPKWRIHYFAHLDAFQPDKGIFIKPSSSMGSVGDSGNARGKPPHLHYSVISLVPRPWMIDQSTQGYKKAFFMDPIKYLNDS